MKQLKTDMNSLCFAVIHIAKSLEKATARPKPAKEYACPNPLINSPGEGSTGYNKAYTSVRENRKLIS